MMTIQIIKIIKEFLILSPTRMTRPLPHVDGPTLFLEHSPDPQTGGELIGFSICFVFLITVMEKWKRFKCFKYLIFLCKIIIIIIYINLASMFVDPAIIWILERSSACRPKASSKLCCPSWRLARDASIDLSFASSNFFHSFSCFSNLSSSSSLASLLVLLVTYG